MRLMQSALFLYLWCEIAQSLRSESNNNYVANRIEVARCRSRCLVKFLSDPNETAEPTCAFRPHCYACWESCDHLVSNPGARNQLCRNKEICNFGCQQACRFFHHLPVRQSLPAVFPNLELHLEGSELRWTLTGVSHRARFPGLVFILFEGINMKELNQLSKRHAVLRSQPADGLLTVVAVDRWGVVAKTKQEVPSLSTQSWHLRQTSIRVNRAVGLASVEVAWSTPAPLAASQEYLVTWEVSTGGLKGHLYTDTPEVTLSLLPDTTYYIQVSGGSSTSRVLTVTTSTEEVADRQLSDEEIVSVKKHSVGGYADIDDGKKGEIGSEVIDSGILSEESVTEIAPRYHHIRGRQNVVTQSDGKSPAGNVRGDNRDADQDFGGDASDVKYYSSYADTDSKHFDADSTERHNSDDSSHAGADDFVVAPLLSRKISSTQQSSHSGDARLFAGICSGMILLVFSVIFISVFSVARCRSWKLHLSRRHQQRILDEERDEEVHRKDIGFITDVTENSGNS